MHGGQGLFLKGPVLSMQLQLLQADAQLPGVLDSQSFVCTLHIKLYTSTDGSSLAVRRSLPGAAVPSQTFSMLSHAPCRERCTQAEMAAHLWRGAGYWSTQPIWSCRQTTPATLACSLPAHSLFPWPRWTCFCLVTSMLSPAHIAIN